MALLDNSTVTGVVAQTVAAYLPQHLVRLGELQSLLAGYQQAGSGINTAQIAGLSNFIDAAVAALIQDTNSIAWTYNSGVPSLLASVALAPGGGLGVNGQGLFVQVGSGANEVAPGNVMPSGLPILPVTLLSGGTVTVGAFSGRAIPANFQSGTPLQSVSFEVTPVPSGGVLATPSGVQADFGPAYTQVARGADLLALASSMTELETAQVTTLSTASVALSLLTSPGLPAGATFPVLFERAGEVLLGDSVGGQYELDYPVQIERVAITAMASSSNTVFELMAARAGTGLTVTVPSGVANTRVTAFLNPATPIVQLPLIGTGRTAPLTWQCISGSPAVWQAISQVDLIMYALVLAGGPTTSSQGNRLSAAVILDPAGGLETTANGVGVIYGDYVAEESPADTVAPGNHTHNFPELAAYNTPSLSLMINSEQQMSGEVNLDADPPFGYGRIAVDENGLAVVLGTSSDTAAAGNHTHQAVSQSGSGFMTPAMLADLQGATGGIGQVANYYRYSNCPVGAYIGGGLRWSQAMQVIGVNVVAQTPPQYNQILSLMLGGVRQALSITIPSGVPGMDVLASVDGSTSSPLAIIPMESSSGVWTVYARWQCTSGLGTLAEEVNLAMNVAPLI